MKHQRHKPRRMLGKALEELERREMLTSVPFGASSQDAAEFLLGDVLVNVVFVESDGSIDASTEDWTQEDIDDTKARIEEGVLWWSDTLENYSDVHKLNFTFDFSLADDPYESSYEPITRKSQDFRIWIEEFYRDQDVTASTGFSTEIRNLNHEKRVEYDTNWAFTIFVVKADQQRQFAAGSDFSRAFAFTGGRFIIMPHHRPAATVAHEVAHMFWAHDEYPNSDSYFDERGYYRTQNTNAVDDNPTDEEQESSILVSTTSSATGPYVNHLVSESARETLGWKDSDGDGIFDVLDVDHSLDGTITFDEATRIASFTGTSSVQTLPNLNPVGTGNDITINRITDLQYRYDGGAWLDLAEFDDYQVTIDVATPPIPESASSVEFRTIDDRILVTSNSLSLAVESTSLQLQNPVLAEDVSGDGFVSPVDVLLVIQAINMSLFVPETSGPPFYDVSGDGFVTPRDVLAVINYINTAAPISASETASEAAEQRAQAVSFEPVQVEPPQGDELLEGEGESESEESAGDIQTDVAADAGSDVTARDAIFALLSSQRERDDD